MDAMRFAKSAIAIFATLVAMSGCNTHHSDATKSAKKEESSTPKLAEAKPPEAKPAEIAMPEITVDTPSGDNPVAVAAAVGPEPARAGGAAVLFIKAKALAGWHFYSIDKPTGVNKPTKIDVTLPAGFEFAGDWVLPDSHKEAKAVDETWTYDGEVIFKRPLKIATTAAAGKIKFKFDFAYQACREEICKPPTSVTVDVPVTIEAGK